MNHPHCLFLLGGILGEAMARFIGERGGLKSIVEVQRPKKGLTGAISDSRRNSYKFYVNDNFPVVIVEDSLSLLLEANIQQQKWYCTLKRDRDNQQSSIIVPSSST